MINAEFLVDNENRINGFRLVGHAGYAESGFDIICAAVSAIAINTINSISQFTDDKFTVNQDEKDGLLEFKMTALSDYSELLLKSMRLGILSISDEYGSEYVKIVK